MLVGVELVQEFIESVIMTGRIKRHAPVSTLVIGEPESGKTSIVTNKNCKAIAVFTDVTGRGLVEVCRTSPEVSHVVLNDLVQIMSHKQTVNRYTLSIVNAMTEEGIQAFATPGGIEKIDSAKGKRGIIACLTMDLAKDGRAWWNKTGFTSRMLPFAFSHSAALTLRIKSLIDSELTNGTGKIKTKELRIPTKPVQVYLPQKYTREIRKLADQKATELNALTGEKGYRRLKQFRSLACGHALRRSFRRPSVGDAEIEFLRRILPYIAYDKLYPL